MAFFGNDEDDEDDDSVYNFKNNTKTLPTIANKAPIMQSNIM